MLRNLFLFIQRFECFLFSNDVGVTLLIDQNNVWPGGDKLQPLRVVIGANPSNHVRISFLEQGKNHILSDDVNVHA